MKLEEKIYRLMLLRGLNQQKLSQLAQVSDSEISRLLNGQSKRPGLNSVFRLARALEVSVDFLADDELEADPHQQGDPLSRDERDVLDRARSLGLRNALMVLDASKILGFETAIRRLYASMGSADRDPTGPSDTGSTRGD